MPKRYSPLIKPIIKTTGILIVVEGWQYGNQAITYVSNKAHSFIVNNKLNNLAEWFTAEYVTAVTLGSQIFIKACGNHSPSINYVEKSIIGLEYYTLTAISSTLSKVVLDNIDIFDQQVKKYSSIGIGIVAGAIVGNFAQKYTENPLDTGMKFIDNIAGMVIGAIAGASSAIIGNYDHND